ncbi:DNA cytosine methyltransferase [Candidatus Woesearchaeota archaeon]|nr:DNA cytosine methyltransferase [Candidatus Woesearchaeota archaeon]
MKEMYTVADFFCGAGGFSEGFRHAGFKVIFALDNWEIARQTHKLNHPESKHPGLDCYYETKGDILLIPPERVNEIVEDVDVIIGSPPCVSFSSSNRAGKADKSIGIKLIEKYFQIIAIKKHKINSRLKYWIMENVPNSRSFLKKYYTFKDLELDEKKLRKLGIKKKEIDIALEIDTSARGIYNSVHFGVPQKRERFICGDFVVPEKKTPEEKDWMILGLILNSLRPNGSIITDPIYNINIPDEELTDHRYDTTMPEAGWRQARLKKQQARYYGRMSFPEDENAPSRTIMATKSNMTREAMIFSNGKPNVYRIPTIREIASIMSFPITYLFQGNNQADKYRLVGNAVCPKLAFAFAEAILKAERKRRRIVPPTVSDKRGLFLNLRETPPPPIRIINKHPLANFAEIVPNLKTCGFRVELDNNFPRTGSKSFKWKASIHHATGKDSMKVCFPKRESIISLLENFKEKDRIHRFISFVEKKFKTKIPPTKEFQRQHCMMEKDNGLLTPVGSLQEASEIVEKFFPIQRYGVAKILNKKGKKSIIHFDKGNPPKNSIPLRIAAALFICNHIVQLTKKK